jgi:hypothetical protein
MDASELLLLPLTHFLSLASLALSQLLKNAAWGLWFRLITGSGLSMVDMATDINMIFVYFGEDGQEGYGWMMLGMVLASMGLQLLLVVGQNGRAGWGKLLWELLIAVSGLKPGVDAMRVVSNAGMAEHQIMDAKTELVATKCAEMFCESIPGKPVRQSLLGARVFRASVRFLPAPSSNPPALSQAVFCRSTR